MPCTHRQPPPSWSDRWHALRETLTDWHDFPDLSKNRDYGIMIVAKIMEAIVFLGVIYAVITSYVERNKQLDRIEDAIQRLEKRLPKTDK